MLNSIEINAFAAAELEDLNTYTVGLYDHPEEVNEGYEIQKSLEFDDQDVDLGMDTYCLVDSIGRTVYGCIDSCTFEGNILSFELNEKAREVFKSDELKFQLMIGGDGIDKVLNGLNKIFFNDPKAPKTNF